jgi:uncharacterized protein YecE (DUF72 family)
MVGSRRIFSTFCEKVPTIFPACHLLMRGIDRITEPLLALGRHLLRDHQIALVLQDRSWMPDPLELQFDPITTDWTYIRWLGDRKQIEAQTMTWDKAVIDRTTELSSWVEFCYQIMKRGVLIYAYANNHFQGHGPATIAKFLELWATNGFGKIVRPEPSKQQATLFPTSSAELSASAAVQPRREPGGFS